MEESTPGFKPLKEPTAKSKSSAIWIVILIAVACFMGFMGLVFGVAVGGAAGGAQVSGLQEVLVDGEADAEKKIAAIPIQGVIMESMGAGPGTVSQVKKTLKAIEKDDSVVGILLVIDTPGGGVTASDRIYHDLLEFKKESKLPVHAIFLDVAASGGYYVAMASDHITAHPTTVTGSIGVISKFFNFTEAMDKIGVSVNVVKSLNSEGKVSFKDMGSPYRPMNPEERKLLQGLITEMWERFTDIVAAGREGKISPEEVKKLADGRVFTGQQALELKLVDSVGYAEDAYKEIRKAAGHDDAKIVSYRKEPGLAQVLGLSASTDIYDITGPQLGLVKKVFAEQSGFLYLWTAGGL
jgi:protease IV